MVPLNSLWAQGGVGFGMVPPPMSPSRSSVDCGS
jgi:hypothetical protein